MLMKFCSWTPDGRLTKTDHRRNVSLKLSFGSIHQARDRLAASNNMAEVLAEGIVTHVFPLASISLRVIREDIYPLYCRIY
jgi:hypothetical protein